MRCAERCLPVQASVLPPPAPHTSAPVSQVEEKALSLQHTPSPPKCPSLPCTQLSPGGPFPPPHLPGSGGTGMQAGLAEAKTEQLSISRKSSFFSI